MSFNLSGLRLVTLEGMRGLSAVDIAKAKDVLEFHLGNMSTWTKGAIAYEAITGKYDTISKELSVALVDICDYALSGLISPDQVKAIILRQIASFDGNTRTAILSEAISGKFDTLINQVSKITDKICVETKNVSEGDKTKGNDDGNSTDGVKPDNSWMLYAGGALVLAGAIYYYTSKPKGKKRGKK